MDVAIIGAGYSGLSAVRRCKERNINNCVAFEINNEVGGLWVYTEQTGTDTYGIPIQSSLYESVRTNSPKQTMELPDFPFKTIEDTCYPRHEEIRRYLNEFAKHFELLPYIKFQHFVTRVFRKDEKWHLIAKNLRENKEEEFEFDAVIICNGHTTKPHIPNFYGTEEYEGIQLHSHEYRQKNIFVDKNVLVIGNRASGSEIAFEASSVAKKTVISRRKEDNFEYPNNIIPKLGIRKLNKNSVCFKDGTTEYIDVIVYCTGYEYYFPFLDETCKIKVHESGKMIYPLYRHFINIEEPTMSFIGLFPYTIISYLFDMQVQAFIKIIMGDIKLPSKVDMLGWLKSENKRKANENIELYYSLADDRTEKYFNDLCSFANLKNLPPVFFKIFMENQQLHFDHFQKYRTFHFSIIDDENYILSYKE